MRKIVKRAGYFIKIYPLAFNTSYIKVMAKIHKDLESIQKRLKCAWQNERKIYTLQAHQISLHRYTFKMNQILNPE